MVSRVRRVSLSLCPCESSFGEALSFLGSVCHKDSSLSLSPCSYMPEFLVDFVVAPEYSPIWVALQSLAFETWEDGEMHYVATVGTPRWKAIQALLASVV